MSKSPVREQVKLVKLEEFALHMKPFQFYGSQRDLSPELKRIVKNLVCQDHKYLYCPCCRKFEESDLNPIENIEKFMKFIKAEQMKLEPQKKKVEFEPKKKGPKNPEMPDDSVSEITDLEKEEILAKYYHEKMSEADKKKKQRIEARRRLLGDVGLISGKEDSHLCPGKRGAENHADKVDVVIRQKSEGVLMQDEENSAH